jgi:hypothetical protein
MLDSKMVTRHVAKAQPCFLEGPVTLTRKPPSVPGTGVMP